MSVRTAVGFEARMAALDARLEAHVAVPASLEPGRDRATPLAALGVRLAGQRTPAWQAAFAATAETIVASLIEHFPGNLYWDLDYLLAALVADAEDPDALIALGATVAELQAQFGCRSPIGFRYLHDFSYGFDWARWTARRPAQRRDIGPFSVRFLAHLAARGREIAASIAAGDARFPRLAPGEFRNPFPFSRTPRHERRLLEDLAGRDLLPIHAWCSSARPRFDLPFADLREERARALGIPPT